MGRPLKEPKVDEETIKRLAAVGCTMGEMATITGLSERTLHRRFVGVIETGRAERKRSLRRKQTELAMNGDRTMLIWLGKQDLGQRDNLDHRVGGEDGRPIEVNVHDARAKLAGLVATGDAAETAAGDTRKAD